MGENTITAEGGAAGVRHVTPEETLARDRPAAPQERRSFLTDIGDWLNARVGGRLYSVTQDLTARAETASSGQFKARNLEPAVPLAGALAVAGTGFVLYEPIRKLGKGLMSAVKALATGFGYFEKIPLIGGAFTYLGKGLDFLGDIAGAGITAVASLLAFKALQPPVAPPVAPANQRLEPERTSLANPPPVLIHPPALRPLPVREAVDRLRTAKEALREAFRPGTEQGRPARAADTARLKELMGEEGLRDFLRRALPGEPAADGSHPQLTEGRARALLEMVEASRGHASAQLRHALEAAQTPGMARRAVGALIRATPLLAQVRRLLLSPPPQPLTAEQIALQEAALHEVMRKGILSEAAELAAQGRHPSAAPAKPVAMADSLAADPALERVLAEAAANRPGATDAVDAVRDTIEWMRNHGDRAQYRAATEIAADPQRLRAMIEAYASATPERRAELGMLSERAMAEFRAKIAADAAVEVRRFHAQLAANSTPELMAKNGLTEARISALEGVARDTLAKMQGQDAAAAERAAAERITAEQLKRAMLDFHLQEGVSNARSMTEAVMEASGGAPAAETSVKAGEAPRGQRIRAQADALETRIREIAAQRSAANTKAGTGPGNFSDQAIGEVRATLEWLERPGAALHNKVAEGMRSDPNRVADLLQQYDATPEASRAQGMLNHAAMEQYRKAIVSEAVEIIRVQQPKMASVELAKLEKLAAGTLQQLHDGTGVDPAGQAAGRKAGAAQLAEALTGGRAAAGTAPAAAPPPADAAALTARLVEVTSRPAPAGEAPAAAAPKPVRAGFSAGRVTGTAFDVMIIMHTLNAWQEKGRVIRPGDVLESRADGSKIVVTQPGAVEGVGSLNLTQPLTLQHVDAAGHVLGSPMHVTMVDPSDHMRRLAQTGMAGGAAANMLGRKNIGGRVMMVAYLAQEAVEGAQQLGQHKPGAAAATAAGAGGTVAVWLLVPGGFLAGTAPSRFAKEVEAAQREGRPIDADAIFYETLPGMVVAPVGQVDQIIGEMMQGMPRNAHVTLPPDADGTLRAVDLDAMYRHFPQYRNAVLSLPWRNLTPQSEEETQAEIDRRRARMLDDPIHAWMQICASHGKTFPEGDEGRRLAGQMLMEYSSYAAEDIRPGAGWTMTRAVGHRLSDWATGDPMTFDEEMKHYALAIAAREIREYAEIRYPSVSNPLRGTSAQAQAPLAGEALGVSIPMEPRPVPVPAEAPPGADAGRIMTGEYAQTVRRDLRENLGKLTGTSAYTAWMRFESGRYLNTLSFLEQTRAVLGSPDDAARETQARQRLVEVLTRPVAQNGVGLSDAQARQLVPHSPRERITLFAGDGGIQADGYDFPPALEAFARAYEAHIGVGTIPVSRGNKAVGVAYDAMNVKEKQEWLTSALDRYERDLDRYAGRTNTIASGGMHGGGSYSYIDYKIREGWYLFSERPDALSDTTRDGRTLTYKQDHEGLRDTVAGAVIASLRGRGISRPEFDAPPEHNSIGNSYPNREFHARPTVRRFLRNQLAESGRQMQQHMERLEQAKDSGGTIHAYIHQARFMEASLGLANDGLVLLASNRIGEGRDTSGGVTPTGADWIALRDLHTQRDHYAVGRWNEQGGFHVERIVTSDGKSSTAADIDLDLRNPAHFSVNQRLVQAMGVLRNGAQAQAEHVRHFNAAAPAFDAAGVALIASSRTADGRDLSTGSASAVRPGDWILLRDKGTGEMLYLEGAWKKSLERGVEEVTQVFEVQRVKGSDGTVLLDEAALSAMDASLRTLNLTQGSRPPTEIFTRLRERQGAQSLSSAAPRAAAREEAPLAFNAQAPLTVSQSQALEGAAMEVVAEQLSRMGISLSGTALTGAPVGTVREQAAAAVGSVTAEMLQGVSGAGAAALPARSSSEAGRSSSGGAPVV